MHLLLDELNTLSRTPYFNKSLEQYLDNLIQAVKHVISEYETLPPDVSSTVTQSIWIATKYLHGGTSKSVPYETVYALRLALEDWVTQPCAITTALRDDLDYHFWGVDPGQVIEKFIPRVKFNSELIQIALPKLYRHYPLYNVALYHELGHFVDTKCGIVSFSLLLKPVAKIQDPKVVEAHRKEHFADLFAASYTGSANSLFLNAVAPGVPASVTHPATMARVQVVDDFLSGKSNSIVDFYQDVLSKRGLPNLEKRYTTPDLTGTFDSIRTYQIPDDKELHGIIDAGWNFLFGAYKQNREPWDVINKEEIMRIVNDLIEKSIRNRMVRVKWDAANNGATT